ncbi:hypothetical protein DSM3645_11646 [Blastopirellula marina DSM 3645]|uniref:Carboxypeptidase regulatory-like domain-containing protein n=2 Tax=Blastopirellula marina TaxID=124 RepID=A4A2U2_9BACT|nr:hypothetical protein DSM3645_11646 [Blastopirellula marina DSM 3645]
MMILAVCAAFAIGCTPTNSEPSRVEVSGVVTIDGQPLPTGLIHFKTVSEGAIDSMEIVEGKFAGQAEPGKRRVEITAYRAASGGTPGMGGGEVNYVPAKYNAESKLTADVSSEGLNEFRFEVTSK